MTFDQPVSASFLSEVQSVLQAFYNPSELQKSRLVKWLALEQERDPAAALRRIFRETIRALKPEDRAPHHSTVWRVYYVLTSRYIEQLSQKEVADELSLSTRQVRRYERLAALLLANALWSQFAPQSRMGDVTAGEGFDEAPGLPAKALPAEHEQELSWIKSSNPVEIASVTGVISSALKTISPLIHRSGGIIQYDAPDHLPPISGQISSIKQALLELLTAAWRADHGGTVWVSAEKVQQQLRVQVRTFKRAPIAGRQVVEQAGANQLDNNRETIEKVDIARQLVALSDGRLELHPVEGSAYSFHATLILPAADQVTVLAIDDNADALQLLQRFLSGSRYQLIVTDNPERAFQMIEETLPQIILLDVMMPGVDGWEMLGRLREHPQTGDVPVIVSTILLQEELALALGAAGFLRKPLTQQALLTALDQQVALFAKE